MAWRFSVLRMMVLAGIVLGMAAGAGAAEKPPVPDLTRGGSRDNTHDWTLGPTGARGWIWGWMGHTINARQILVTEVATSSPAEGVLEVGDVILGVDGKPFADDARILFARAITAAETENGGGVLKLIRWRQGSTQSVQIKLPVMGTYSVTAPYSCPKTQRIIERGCEAIAKQGWKDKRGNIAVSIPNDLNALALLACGAEKHRPLVAEYAQRVAEHTPGGHISWGYAYSTLFLAEYALATGDQSVMPGLRRLTMDIARGQSGVGTWGHAFARPEDKILNGYGCMNQPGIVLTLAMAVAREAGVKSPELDEAIRMGARFVRWYVHKGAIPYGDHDPWPDHDDNGKCSSGAVLFDLLKDREAAAFFSRMGTAAYAERECGHTGNFFNMLWALPGVSRSGVLATGAYFREQSWYYDLARGWDGRFIYPGIPGNWGGHSYDGWDCTGAYLLAYALPLKKTIVTGRRPTVVPALSAAEVAETIAAGQDFTFWTKQTCYDGRSTEALLAGLKSWSPAVRKRSARALGSREGDFVPQLLRMLVGTDPDARYGACEALAFLGPKADPAAGTVRALLADRDPWIRILASGALARMGQETRTASIADLLRTASRPDPTDPRGRVHGPVAEALFTPSPGKREPKAILADSLEGVDRTLLHAAIRSLLKNEDGRIRTLVVPAYRLLPPEDLAALMPDIVAAIRTPAPSGEMFAYGIRFAGLDVLAKLQIREGMALCIDILNEHRWGRDLRRPVAALSKYGGNAKEFLPQLREVRATAIAKDRNWEKNEDRKREIAALDKLIAQIDSDANPPKLRSMAEFIRQTRP